MVVQLWDTPVCTLAARASIDDPRNAGENTLARPCVTGTDRRNEELVVGVKNRTTLSRSYHRIGGVGCVVTDEFQWSE